MTVTDLNANGPRGAAPAPSGDLDSVPLDSTVGDSSAAGTPMVGIAIRLPVATLDAARSIARSEGVKVTAMLREWIDQHVAERVDDEQVVTVADLRRLIAHRAHAAQTAPQTGAVEPHTADDRSTGASAPSGAKPKFEAKAKAKSKESRTKSKDKAGAGTRSKDKASGRGATKAGPKAG